MEQDRTSLLSRIEAVRLMCEQALREGDSRIFVDKETWFEIERIHRFVPGVRHLGTALLYRPYECGRSVTIHGEHFGVTAPVRS